MRQNTVGLAEDVRNLKRAYRVAFWFAGVIASAVVVQAVVAIREIVVGG